MPHKGNGAHRKPKDPARAKAEEREVAAIAAELVARIKAKAREPGAPPAPAEGQGAAAEGVLDLVRRHPVPSVLLALGVGFLLGLLRRP
jgi:hypothetical protein